MPSGANMLQVDVSGARNGVAALWCTASVTATTPRSAVVSKARYCSMWCNVFSRMEILSRPIYKSFKLGVILVVQYLS